MNNQHTSRILSNQWLSLLLQAAAFVALLWGIAWWQQRGSLADGNALAPDFTLTDLRGETFALSQQRGRRVLLYFFAPWCRVCRLSADNLNALRADRDAAEWRIVTVGLDWPDRQSLEEFKASLDLQVPVLMGTEAVQEEYRIKAYPTYYVIDAEGRVESMSMGYSTELGLRFRT